MRHLLLLIVLISVGCSNSPSQQDSTTSVINEDDPLRNSMTWLSSTPYWATDINPNGQPVQVIHWILAYDEECESAALLNNGTMTVSFSTEISQSQTGDMGCSYFDGTWSYSETNGALKICKTAPNVESCVTLN